MPSPRASVQSPATITTTCGCSSRHTTPCTRTAERVPMAVRRELGAVFVAKTARTYSYGALGVVFPVYLSDLGVGAVGIGTAVTLTLAGSAALTWAVRRPAERYGARAALLGLAALTAISALMLLTWRAPWAVVAAAM